MRKSSWLYLFVLLVVTLPLFFMFWDQPERKNDMSISWIGTYSFYEYLPPNLNMDYSIQLFEDNSTDDHGLYAHIEIDGFQTLQRLRAKVLFDNNSIHLEFDDYFIDEDGNETIYESFEKGDILLSLTIQEDTLITVWGKIHPMIAENEVSGQYFIKF